MTSEEKKSLKEANLADKMKQYELETKLVPNNRYVNINNKIKTLENEKN